MAESEGQSGQEPKRSDLKESFAMLFFGLICGSILIYRLGVEDYNALTVLFVVPIIMLSIAKGFRFGALLSIICGAAFGTLILIGILNERIGPGAIVDNMANLAIIIGFGFVLGIVSEYFRFGIGEQWRQETTVIETFVPDQETGLYNFKSFRWMLRGDLARLKRYNRPMSVVFFRMRGLSEFRSQYENIEEFKLFREIGLFMRELVRESDYIGRYSDDEVAIALPETDREGCMKMITRVQNDRNLLKEAIVARWKNAKIRFQISHATFPQDAKTIEELVNVLDNRYSDF